MPGCRNFAKDWASLRKRFRRSRDVARTGGRTLTATSRSTCFWLARKTIPIAPRPTSSLISKSPRHTPIRDGERSKLSAISSGVGGSSPCEESGWAASISLTCPRISGSPGHAPSRNSCCCSSGSSQASRNKLLTLSHCSGVIENTPRFGLRGRKSRAWLRSCPLHPREQPGLDCLPLATERSLGDAQDASRLGGRCASRRSAGRHTRPFPD